MKRLFLALAATLSFIGYAQIVSNVDFFPEKDNVIVTYSLASPTPSISLFFSRNGGDWVQLKQVSGDVGNNVQPGNKRIVWDIYKEMPEGIADSVKFAVLSDYMEPTVETLPEKFPKENTVIRGNKAYGAKKINYTKKYFGDVRDGAWASATDYVTYTVNIYKYDFITDETILFDSFEWKGRVVRGWPSRGRGEAYRDDKEPPHRMNIDDKGHICIDSKIIIE